MKARSASVALPLPIDSLTAEAMRNILAGLDGKLSGYDLWRLLPQLGANDFGTARQRPYSGYNDQIVFLKWDDGVLMIEQIFPAGVYNADFIRRIVGFCVTPSRFMRDMYNDAPTVEQLAAKLL